MSRNKFTRTIMPAVSVFIILSYALASASDHQHVERTGDHGHIRVLIDTDMGLDDVRALFALVGSDRAEIPGIVVVEGSASLGKGTDNLLGLLESVGRTDIQAYRGRDAGGLEEPSWRRTANSLTGESFPPPRELSALRADHDVLDKLIGGPGEDLNYLAIGPLGNLAGLFEAHPEASGYIEKIWIPARISEDGGIDSWNMEWDDESARTVFQKAHGIVLIDVTGFGGLNIEEIADGNASSPAARWIRALAASSGGSEHAFAFDEIAAAALLRPDLFEHDAGKYSLAGERGLRIVPARDGNIRVARAGDIGEITEFLHELWEGPAYVEHNHSHDQVSGISPVRLIKSFHGHLGPYVVLGYRMGRIAIEELGSTGHFGLHAEVHSILEPPRSCLIDGVQMGSGCTLGKRNIDVTDYDGPPYLVMETDNGGRVEIRLLDHIPAMIGRLIENEGVEAAGMRMFGEDPAELFEIKLEAHGSRGP